MTWDEGALHVGEDKQHCPNLYRYEDKRQCPGVVILACCCLTPAQEAELDALLAKAKP